MQPCWATWIYQRIHRWKRPFSSYIVFGVQKGEPSLFHFLQFHVPGRFYFEPGIPSDQNMWSSFGANVLVLIYLLISIPNFMPAVIRNNLPSPYLLIVVVWVSWSNWMVFQIFITSGTTFDSRKDLIQEMKLTEEKCLLFIMSREVNCTSISPRELK